VTSKLGFDMSAELDFCAGCGGWVAADTGTMRQGSDGEAEIVCNDCLTIEQNRAALCCACRNGTLDDV